MEQINVSRWTYREIFFTATGGYNAEKEAWIERRGDEVFLCWGDELKEIL